MTIEAVDPIAWVRRNGAMFFPEGRFDAVRLLAWIMADVVGLGGGECRIANAESWWLVASNVDWLAQEKWSVRELFDHVVVAPQHGEHSMRAEILVAVFAADVFTTNGTDDIAVKGSGPDPQLIRRGLYDGWAKRLLGFRVVA